MSSRAEDASGEISRSGYTRGRLPSHLARPEELERRSHPCAWSGSNREGARLTGDPDGTHSRYIEAAIDGVLVGCLYLPNGNPAPGPKFDYKLRWLERLTKHADTLLATAGSIVLAGDYNVIPTTLDVYKPERWLDDALFRPEVRDAFAHLVGRGWTDALRQL